MIKRILFLGLVISAGALLPACNKSSDRNALQATDFGTGSSRPEDQFGKSFSEKFHADPNSDPANVSDNELPPVSPTTDPVPID